MKVKVTSKMNKNALYSGMAGGLLKIGAISSLSNSIVDKIEPFIKKNVEVKQLENGNFKAFLNVIVDGNSTELSTREFKIKNLNFDKIMKVMLRDKLIELLGKQNIEPLVTDTEIIWEYETEILFGDNGEESDRTKRKKEKNSL